MFAKRWLAASLLVLLPPAVARAAFLPEARSAPPDACPASLTTTHTPSNCPGCVTTLTATIADGYGCDPCEVDYCVTISCGGVVTDDCTTDPVQIACGREFYKDWNCGANPPFATVSATCGACQ